MDLRVVRAGKTRENSPNITHERYVLPRKLEQSKSIRRRANAAMNIQRSRGEQEAVSSKLFTLLRKSFEIPQLADRHAEQGQEVLM